MSKMSKKFIFNSFSIAIIAALLFFYAFVTFFIFSVEPVCANDGYSNAADSRNYGVPQTIKIGVTAPRHDNVGQILSHFGAGVDFYSLSRANTESLESLSKFYAVFINCGSHGHIDPRVLSSFVYQGGIVYASDHAGRVLQAAFPDVVEFATSPAQVVSKANVVHSTLASHMRASYLRVVFDLGGWYAITSLDDKATVYIEGNIRGDIRRRGIIPLAMSFNYGQGTVFYTSFHNSAQATSHMINFIEYLIFRIKNVEVDRNLQYIARREGFVYRGAVFESPVAAYIRAGLHAASSGGIDIGISRGLASLAPFPADIGAAASEAVYTPESFRYTFGGEDFMLMFGAGSEFYYVILTDPYGNTFSINNYGEIISNITDQGAIQPSITLEASDGYRVLVSGVSPGEWGFSAMPRSGDHSTFMIGIAVMQE